MNQPLQPLLINVVSGKGGTGKSLLCALLGRLLAQEGARVLLVDFDLFVRGLSHFHYRYIKERRRITDARSVADYFELGARVDVPDTLAKERFFEVDLVPAVSEIEEHVNYLEVAADTIKKAKRILNRLRDEEEYQYVLIDNRAGVDEIIIETSRVADISISVAESDPISRTTNDNLLRHLSTSRVGKVYTIINKVKYLRSFEEYEAAVERISGDFDVIGQIPFDLDLFETFGTARFWEHANSTKYGYGLAETWNRIARRENLKTVIDMDRFPRSSIWKRSRQFPMFLSSADRVSVLMGMVMLIGYWAYDSWVFGFELKDMLLGYAVILLAYPVIRRFVLPRDK